MTEPTNLRDLLARAAERAADYRDTLPDRPVGAQEPSLDHLRKQLGELADDPTPAATVLEELVAAVEPGTIASAGPRYFGFVIGGALDAATAADMMTTAWDQPNYNATSSPAATAVEDVVGAWLKELLGLPAIASFGFVTGGQAANTVCLAAARHEVLARAGWDVESRGLTGAPRVRVVATAERHGTIDRALRLLGLGGEGIEAVPTDANGAIAIDDLRRVLAVDPDAPTIVCVQAGNVNTGAIDDLAGAARAAHAFGAWLHVDGAFGLWVRASPSLRGLADGAELADSWGVDGHKWLNVPYDCGYALCAHPEAHAVAVAYDAAYLHNDGSIRAPGDYVLESSHRARGFATWAALRELGRRGVADLIERSCAHARRFARQLGAIEGVEIVNDVVLNQVLVRFGDDVRTDRVIELTQQSGVCWMGGTTWRGTRCMRISVVNHSTSENDVDLSVAAIAAAHLRVRGEAAARPEES
jgi:glutamate/tyrosine decarboxylase-like PLP-dependent enzyme